MNQRTAFVVFGGATVDHSAATLAAPVMHASNPGRARTATGGVGFNVARGLARLGHRVRMVTRVGRDADGEAVRAAGARDGVDMTEATTSPEGRTATYRAAFDHQGDLIIGIADMAILDELTPAVVAAAIGDGRDEMTVLDANLPAETLVRLVRSAAAAGHGAAAIGVSPAKVVKLAPLLDRIGYLFVTRREAAALLGRPDDHSEPTRALAERLAACGVAHVVVTDSASPLAAAAAGELHLFPPFASHVRSVNGAGDALAAGILHGVAIGRGFFDAVLSGLAAAAITVEDEATVAAGLSASAVEARIARARVVT
jgi:sugar/nucleoside kinase (ribokinase family)